MIILGIDPGKTGGIALIESKRPIMLHGLRMPTQPVASKYTLYPSAIKRVLKDNGMDIRRDVVDAVVIELVNAMPKQGVSSTFQFGRMFGAVESWAHSFYPGKVQYASPSTWKPAMGLTGKTKADSIARAGALFGDKDFWPLKSDDGIAEAALMALWYARFRAPS